MQIDERIRMLSNNMFEDQVIVKAARTVTITPTPETFKFVSRSKRSCGPSVLPLPGAPGVGVRLEVPWLDE